ncbi:hypothetical protein GGI12_002197 [Dipsacomyces acuminosporus]|nr:hypothetical protein GGI12_002197 [Dipsacomyces acuminosporus]
MEQIRYVKIPLAETRTEPDTHVEYALQVQGPVRSWTVWHRYNDFLALASGQLEFIEERRHGLERYIQGMITCEDGRWRTSSALQRFLAPAGKGARYLAGRAAGANGNSSDAASEAGSTSSEAAGWVTAASWLDDQRAAEQVVRDVRQSILRRENALTRNEVSVSHQCTLQAKRKLTELGRAVKILEQGLEQIGASLTAGELLRRQDMLMALTEERGNLTKMVLGPGVVVSSSDKAALLGGASSDGGSSGARVIGRAGNGSSYNMPGALSAASIQQQRGFGQGGSASASSQRQATAPRSRRVFGNSNPPPQETNVTRGLDNQGLLQLQEERMKEQDHIAADFTRLLQRQREMGVAIGNELDLQNQLLSELDQDVDRTGSKLAAARRQASQLR